MERKIVKVGNSYGVIIPLRFLEELELTHQSTVNIEIDRKLNVITIENKETTLKGNYLEQVVKSIVSDCFKEKGL